MKEIIILLGPTGVGKTGVALLLAKALGSEIISADSMQIYRGMDIGTAKPTAAEQARVRHHMIDVAEPSETFSVGRYIEGVLPLIRELHARGRIPVVVGGTGLYIKAMTRGLFAGPPADMPLRETLSAMEEDEHGALYAYLSRLDPEAASKIEKNDTRRIIRAIEVCVKDGRRMSVLQQQHTEPLPYHFIKIGLIRDRKELYRIIDNRVDRMIEQGLFREAGMLLTRNPSMTPLQAIGYREGVRYLEGTLSQDEAISLIKRNTRRYAKRQMTWFRKEDGIHWLDITGLSDDNDIFHLVLNCLRESFARVLCNSPSGGSGD